MALAFEIPVDVAKVVGVFFLHAILFAICVKFKLIKSRRDVYRFVGTSIVLFILFILALTGIIPIP